MLNVRMNSDSDSDATTNKDSGLRRLNADQELIDEVISVIAPRYSGPSISPDLELDRQLSELDSPRLLGVIEHAVALLLVQDDSKGRK